MRNWPDGSSEVNTSIDDLVIELGINDDFRTGQSIDDNDFGAQQSIDDDFVAASSPDDDDFVIRISIDDDDFGSSELEGT